MGRRYRPSSASKKRGHDPSGWRKILRLLSKSNEKDERAKTRKPEALLPVASGEIAIEGLNRWNTQDKSPFLLVNDDGLGLSYGMHQLISRQLKHHDHLTPIQLRIGPLGNSNAKSAAIRAKHWIPPLCGIYYYEVSIIDKGVEGYVVDGLGLVLSLTNKIHGNVRSIGVG